MGRLLALVPYVIEHPGTSVTELTRVFGGTEEELLADLDVLFVTGLPPYGPADLVEVDIDEGRVWISMADHFSRPLRLTRSEALSLYLRGRAALEVGGAVEAPALASALDKLERELGDQTIRSLAAIVETGDAATTGPEEAAILEIIRAGLNDRERVELEYYTASRDEVTTRVVEPTSLFLQLGAWYLQAWDLDADDERTFRVDRIRRATPGRGSFEPREAAGPPALSTPTGAIEVVLRLAPEARWVGEYYEAQTQDDGPTTVATLRVADLAWAAKLVLRLGSSVEVVAPDELTRAVHEEASKALIRYR